MQIKALFLVTASASLASCATHAVDQHYGEAQTQLLREQTYDWTTLNVSQGAHAPTGMDPDQAEAAVELMKKDVTERSSVKSSTPLVTINSQSGGSQ